MRFPPWKRVHRYLNTMTNYTNLKKKSQRLMTTYWRKIKAIEAGLTINKGGKVQQNPPPLNIIRQFYTYRREELDQLFEHDAMSQATVNLIYNKWRNNQELLSTSDEVQELNQRGREARKQLPETHFNHIHTLQQLEKHLLTAIKTIPGAEQKLLPAFRYVSASLESHAGHNLTAIVDNNAT